LLLLLSYAQGDSSGGYLRQFFEDLEKRLAQFSGIKLDQRKLGTLDARTIEQGENWDAVLSRSLTKQRQNAGGDYHSSLC